MIKEENKVGKNIENDSMNKDKIVTKNKVNNRKKVVKVIILMIFLVFLGQILAVQVLKSIFLR